MPRLFSMVLMSALTSACGKGDGIPDAAPPIDAAPPPDATGQQWTAAPPLPEPISNNAVGAIPVGGPAGCTLFSALGIDETRTAAGIVARAWSWTAGDAAWTALPDVPTGGRLAAAGVGLRNRFYVLGGYSVDAGGLETSHTEVDMYDPAVGAWVTVTPLPIAVDDAVVAVWRERFIIVVSGWSNGATIRDLQIYDADRDAWETGNEFAGTPVFGGAGAMVGDELIVIDGVANGPMGYQLVNQAWRGQFDVGSPGGVIWTSLGMHPGPARYRAAAGTLGDQLLFHGGTSDPYNYDGLSYSNGSPAIPLPSTAVYDAPTAGFALTGLPPDKPEGTMDHRGLVGCGDTRYTIGGMIAGPAVTANVWAQR